MLAQKPALQEKLQQWMSDYFYRTLDWVLQCEETQAVPTTVVGLVNNVLSQLAQVQSSRSEFVCYLLRGFAAGFELPVRTKLF